MHFTFRSANDAVDQRASAGQADAAGASVEIKELAIGNVAHGDDLIHTLRIAGEKGADEKKKVERPVWDKAQFDGRPWTFSPAPPPAVPRILPHSSLSTLFYLA